METGSVTFHRPSEVQRISIIKDKDIIKRIMKTKTESHPNLEEQLREHIQEVQRAESAVLREEIAAKKAAVKAKKVEVEERKAALQDMEDAGRSLMRSNQDG